MLAGATALATLLIATALFFLGAWVLSSIPHNADWREPDEGITILIETNGTHTGVVLPVNSAFKDWRETFPTIDEFAPGSVTHVAIGWGEREVFLNVPTWGDLSPLTALRIGFVGGGSIVRVSHYARPAPSLYHRPLRLTPEQYRIVVKRVEDSLAPLEPDGTRTILRGADASDGYYKARGRYTLIRNSNTWTGEVLADAGVRIGWWTPVAGGVMKWIGLPEGV